MRWFGGHLGADVSALVDGQLGPAETERAWEHVLSCSQCRAMVERETWIKRRVSGMCDNEPSARLLGALRGLPVRDDQQDSADLEEVHAWAAVDRLEETARTRRRAALALAGAGSVSAAVVGFAALSTLELGNTPGAPATSINDSTGTPGPTASPTSAVVPTAGQGQQRFSGWRVPQAPPTDRTAVLLFPTR